MLSNPRSVDKNWNSFIQKPNKKRDSWRDYSRQSGIINIEESKESRPKNRGFFTPKRRSTANFNLLKILQEIRGRGYHLALTLNSRLITPNSKTKALSFGRRSREFIKQPAGWRDRNPSSSNPLWRSHHLMDRQPRSKPNSNRLKILHQNRWGEGMLQTTFTSPSRPKPQ